MEVKNKKVLVFGLGISGIGAGKILEAHGADVVLYDGNQKLTEEKVRKHLELVGLAKNLTILLTTHYMEEAQSLCNRVALMDHGKLEEVSTPSALIESLGAYAVDEMTADGTQNHYFHTRQEAIRYLEELTGQASLRETTLEDVFVERAGKHLISK